MRAKKILCTVSTMIMVMSLFVGCGKKNIVLDNNNDKTTQSSTNKEQNSNAQTIESKSEETDLLIEQEILFTGFFARVLKGYFKTGEGGKIVFNESTGDKYISFTLVDNKKELSNVTAEQIENKIATKMYIDDSIAKNVKAYSKNATTKIESISDVEINSVPMKKFEGKVTVAKSSSEPDIKWDCFIYGYIFETERSTMIFYGFEQEQSQPADEIAKMKKNMDAMIKTIRIA